MKKIKGTAWTDGQFWYLKNEKDEFMKDDCGEVFDGADLFTAIQELSDSVIEHGDEIEIIIKRK